MGEVLAIAAIGATLFGGVEQRKALKKQQAAQKEQAKQVRQEREQEASIRAQEISALEQRQQAVLLGRGVSPFSGTPLQFLKETRTLGTRDVEGIRRTGKRQASLIEREAEISGRRANTALLSAFGQAASFGFTSGLFGE